MRVDDNSIIIGPTVSPEVSESNTPAEKRLKASNKEEE